MPIFDAHWPSFVAIPRLPVEVQLHINSFLKPMVIVAQQHFILVKPREYILTGHREPVSALQFTRDGKTFMSASLDGTLRFWANFRTTRIINVGPGQVRHASFTKCEKRIACLHTGKVHLFDVATGQKITCVDLQNPSITLSPFACFNGPQLAMLSTQQVAVFDLKTGRQQVRHRDFMSRVDSMAAHGNLIVASSLNRVYCYKFDDPEHIRYIFMGSLSVSSVAVNGNHIVVMVDGQHAHVYDHRYQLKRVISMSFKVTKLIPGPRNMFVAVKAFDYGGGEHEYSVLLDVEKGGFCKLYQ
jgi:WD40 repeat protein